MRLLHSVGTPCTPRRNWAAKKLQAGHVVGTVVANENRLRLAVSVFNNHDDIDKGDAVLGGKTTSV